MLAAERKKLIVEYLKQNHIATTQTLCDITGASPATIRRDLTLMEEESLLLRTHGGAQEIETADAGSGQLVSNYSHIFSSIRMDDEQFEYKDAIARKAIDLIHSGDILFIGASFTCSLLCRHLNASSKKNIMVVTTNITGALELASNSDIRVFLLSGIVHLGHNHIETLDESTVQSLKKLYFDKLFFTVDGADLEYGYSIMKRTQLPLFNYLVSNVKDSYILLNHAKYRKRTFTHLCNLDDIPNVVTDNRIPPEYVDYFKGHGINLYLA